MSSNRRIAVVAGVVFVIATLAGVAGAAIVRPLLSAPDYLVQIAANENRVILGALLQFIGGVACAGIAIALYPVLRTHNEGLALGSVAFRTIEGALYVLIAVCTLVLLTLGQEAASAGTVGTSASQVAGDVVKSGREWLGPVTVLSFGLGALMYYWVFFQSRLIPRWLSAWGLVGVILVAVSAVLVMFQVIASFSTAQVVLAAPIGLQELVLAVWLIAKGFDQPATAAKPAGERPVLPKAA